MSRILIFPSGNTFSHLYECENIGRELKQFGHDIHYGISKQYASWAAEHKINYSIISELWERGPTDHPNVSWFIDHDYVLRCVEEEIRLINSFEPDIVFADFKYTTSISARAAGARLVTKNILSMLPASGANFGYLVDDDCQESRLQRKRLDFFDRFACFALNSAAEKQCVRKFARLSHFLEGEVVIIPDSPWFQKIGPLPENYQLAQLLYREANLPCGPVVKAWRKCCDIKEQRLESKAYGKSAADTLIRQVLRSKKIFLALGSVCRSEDALYHLTAALADGPWQLYVSLSGKNNSLKNKITTFFPQVYVADFWNFNELAAKGINLYVCQGGLGSIYNAVEHGVNLFVVPFQPEQVHNGMLVEQHGIGGRFGKSHAFNGQEDLYIQTILNTPKEEFARLASELLIGDGLKNKMKSASGIFQKEMHCRPRPAELIDDLLAHQAGKRCHVSAFCAEQCR